MTEDAKNILFIMTDSLVPDFMGLYGDKSGNTPNLSRLAERGTIFENAYCNSPLCAPSRASMTTGRYVSDIGVFDNANSFSSDVPTIAHALSSRGYESTIIGKMHFLGHDQNHGFERIALDTDYSHGYRPEEYSMAFQWGNFQKGNPCSADWMGPSYVKSEKWDNYTLHYDWDNKIHTEALSFLSEKDEKSSPFFCCISYHAPHNPFWVPEELRNIFKDKKLPLPRLPDSINPEHGPMDKWLNAFHYVPEFKNAMMEEKSLRWMYETYYSLIYDLDRRIGELMEVFKRNNLDQNTVIVFSSDHGDMLGNRGMLQKRYLYDRSAKVPLMFVMPGDNRATKCVKEPVSLIDLFPTFADIARADIPDDLPGISLCPAVETGHAPDRPVFVEYHGEGVHAPCYMVRKGDYKYIYVHEYEERLYNLATDPDEFFNLITEPELSDVIVELKEEIFRNFNPENTREVALESQKKRKFIYDAVVKAEA